MVLERLDGLSEVNHHEANSIEADRINDKSKEN